MSIKTIILMNFYNSWIIFLLNPTEHGRSFITSGLALWFYSTHFSTTVCNLGIQEAARWQFCKNTHLPFNIWALAINSSALGPWPLPREIMSRWRVLPFSSLANLSSWLPGSQPAEKQANLSWQCNYSILFKCFYMYLCLKGRQLLGLSVCFPVYQVHSENGSTLKVKGFLARYQNLSL